MHIIDIPGIRYKGRRLTMELLGEDHRANDEDIETALEVRELMLPNKETTIDGKVGFRWVRTRNGWSYIKPPII